MAGIAEPRDPVCTNMGKSSFFLVKQEVTLASADSSLALFSANWVTEGLFGTLSLAWNHCPWQLKEMNQF